MFDILAFQATDFPAKNLIRNGNFIKDSNGDGLADDFVSGGVNFTNPRIENNRQYWYPLITGYSASLNTTFYIPNKMGDKFYIRVDKENVGNVYWWGQTSDSSSVLRIFTADDDDGVNLSKIFTSTIPDEKTRLVFYAKEGNKESFVGNLLLINLTETFGEGNEPSLEQMNELLKIFPHNWFDKTQNIFNAKHFVSIVFRKFTELENAITSLGGGS